MKVYTGRMYGARLHISIDALLLVHLAISNDMSHVSSDPINKNVGKTISGESLNKLVQGWIHMARHPYCLNIIHNTTMISII